MTLLQISKIDIYSRQASGVLTLLQISKIDIYSRNLQKRQDFSKKIMHRNNNINCGVQFFMACKCSTIKLVVEV